MKRARSIFNLAVLGPTLFFCQPVLAVPQVGQQAPDFTLRMLDGKSIQLSSLYKKKLVFLNFFATWCPPCIEETPGIVAAYPLYRDKVNFLSVDVGENNEAVKKFVKEFKMPFPVALDDSMETWGNLYGLRIYPANFILDKGGKVIFAGTFLPEGKLVELLDEALGKTAPAAPPKVKEKRRWWKKDKK